MTQTTAWAIGAAILLLIAVLLAFDGEWSAVCGAVVLMLVMAACGIGERNHRRP